MKFVAGVRSKTRFVVEASSKNEALEKFKAFRIPEVAAESLYLYGAWELGSAGIERGCDGLPKGYIEIEESSEK